MIKALQKTLKRSQYMQNILCFGVFARGDASDNCCDSRLNIDVMAGASEARQSQLNPFCRDHRVVSLLVMTVKLEGGCYDK